MDGGLPDGARKSERAQDARSERARRRSMARAAQALNLVTRVLEHGPRSAGTERVTWVLEHGPRSAGTERVTRVFPRPQEQPCACS
jgi:hypothetical protein